MVMVDTFRRFASSSMDKLPRCDNKDTISSLREILLFIFARMIDWASPLLRIKKSGMLSIRNFQHSQYF